MIEKIITWSSENRFLVLAAYLVICAAGIYSVLHLPVDAIPDLSENQVIVYTEWMGRAPELVETQVTYPVSSAMQGLAGVKTVRATTMFGMSFVFVIFEDGTDGYFARARVTEKLSAMQGQLPAGAVPQLGPDGTGVGHIFWYTVEGRGYDAATLRGLQDWYIKPRLAAVAGVAEIASIGGAVKQYQVDVDPLKLRAYGVTFEAVTEALAANNNGAGGKVIDVSGSEFFVKGSGYITGKEQIAALPLGSATGGRVITIGDVATVQLGSEQRRGLLEKNGEGEVTGGIVVMRSGENARAVIERLREELPAVEAGLPEGVTIVPNYDRGTLIDAAISTLERALWEAAITVALMVALFLLHARSIVRILIELPVAVLIAFLLMYLFNITSNIMSLGGIILAVGVIVDSSIVLVENAYRNLSRALAEKATLSPAEYRAISVQSAVQVGRAIFFSELIILVSFLPVFLLTGQEGKLFRPLAYTKTFAMAGSALVVVTLIPVLMTYLMRGNFREEKKNPVTRFFTVLYEPVIAWVLRHRKLTIALNIAALLAAVPMAMDTGSEFMPPLDEGSLLFMPVTLPDAGITEVQRLLTYQDKITRGIPEVADVLGKAGRAATATDNAPLSMIETIILLKPKDEWRPGITKKDIINELDAKLQVPGVRNGWTQPIINRINMLATGVRTDLGLKIFGPDRDTLARYAQLAEQLIMQVPGAADVTAEQNTGGNYLTLRLKPDAARRYGLTTDALNRIVETAIGGENTGQIIEGRMRYAVRARYLREYRETPEAMGNIFIPLPFSGGSGMEPAATRVAATQKDGNSGMAMGGGTEGSSMAGTGSGSGTIAQPERNFVPLKAIADIQYERGPAMIESENGMLRSLVYFNARGADMGSVADAAYKVIEEQLHLPAGYSVSWSGQYESKMRAQRSIALIMPLVFLIIFILLYFTLKDYTEAGVVMLSVPFALIGGVYTVYALGYNFSVAVWVGFIALYGVAVETGVVMVVYLHEALDKHIRCAAAAGRVLTTADVVTATIEGSVLRLRPKLMTVGTSMIGLVPVMWATGAGADVMKPLTAPLIGGLITSAVHVLVVTPVLFAIMKERALQRGTLSESRMANWMKEA